MSNVYTKNYNPEGDYRLKTRCLCCELNNTVTIDKLSRLDNTIYLKCLRCGHNMVLIDKITDNELLKLKKGV